MPHCTTSSRVYFSARLLLPRIGRENPRASGIMRLHSKPDRYYRNATFVMRYRGFSHGRLSSSQTLIHTTRSSLNLRLISVWQINGTDKPPWILTWSVSVALEMCMITHWTSRISGLISLYFTLDFDHHNFAWGQMYQGISHGRSVQLINADTDYKIQLEFSIYQPLTNWTMLCFLPESIISIRRVTDTILIFAPNKGMHDHQ